MSLRDRSVIGMDLLSTAAAGFGLGLSLIIAIGAQNAYVLRQGIRAEHVTTVVTICAISDAVLILVGISGIGLVLEQVPDAITVIRWLGAAFLVGYGLLAARRAVSPHVLEASRNDEGTSRKAAVMTVSALTWLNPHVYLDTVLLVGSVANTHGSGDRWVFGAGAVVGSLLWFGALGYGARLLRGVFARPSAWRILDGAIAVIMIALGILLIVQA